MSWNKIFNIAPRRRPANTWQKMFNPDGVKNAELDEITCLGARAIYGDDSELVKRHCSPAPKPKFRIVFK